MYFAQAVSSFQTHLLHFSNRFPLILCVLCVSSTAVFTLVIFSYTHVLWSFSSLIVYRIDDKTNWKCDY